mmetsp:Transcript_32897/g.72559  ORF Transcript_32897/g.72559 Transcript_32897/m.72559 type:complete len:303 (+) Transcript_32897:294-1202(+)
MSTEEEGGEKQQQQELSRASERPPSGPLEADPVVKVPTPETPTPVASNKVVRVGSDEGGGANTATIGESSTTTEGPRSCRQSPSSISPKATDSTTDDSSQSHQTTSTSSRQVIAVSASKGPAAFFNLARKFLITDEIVDLSALEGAIVSAVDAAHLLERSKLASIIRIHTSYVAVEPKRKRHDSVTSEEPSPQLEPQSSPYAHSDTTAAHAVSSSSEQQDKAIYSSPPGSVGDASNLGQKAPHHQQQQQSRAKGSPLKRARIIITVKRTPEYKQWLDENPSQAIIGAAGGDVEIAPHPPGAP